MLCSSLLVRVWEGWNPLAKLYQSPDFLKSRTLPNRIQLPAHYILWNDLLNGNDLLFNKFISTIGLQKFQLGPNILWNLQFCTVRARLINQFEVHNKRQASSRRNFLFMRRNKINSRINSDSNRRSPVLPPYLFPPYFPVVSTLRPCFHPTFLFPPD